MGEQTLAMAVFGGAGVRRGGMFGHGSGWRQQLSPRDWESFRSNVRVRPPSWSQAARRRRATDEQNAWLDWTSTGGRRTSRVKGRVMRVRRNLSRRLAASIGAECQRSVCLSTGRCWHWQENCGLIDCWICHRVGLLSSKHCKFSIGSVWM